MNVIGKKNIVLGFAYLVATLSLGFYMAYAMFASGERATWLNSAAHALIKTAHVHGNLESVVNIIGGLVICLFGSRTPRLCKTASILLILGAVFHSGMFYLGGLGVPNVVRLGFFGPVLLIAGIVLLVPISWKGITADRVAM